MQPDALPDGAAEPDTTPCPPHPLPAAQDASPHADAPATPAEALLDEALRETFPASDPISPSSVAADDEPPASCSPPPAPSDAPIPFPTADTADADAAPQGGRRGAAPEPAARP